MEDQKLPTNLMDIYRVLKIGDDRLVEIDASGSTEEVLRRVQEVVISKCEQWRQLTPVSVPISVNWHFTRQCNYHCEFCFHTAKTSFCLPSTKDGLEESKRCLARLRDAGMQKINFSGGEPFLHAKALGTLVRFCKEELRLESVSIVSNGSHITAKWMEEFGYFLDILAISCDSFHEATNVLIGRGRGEHVKQLESIRQWCDDFEVLFKINSVITKHNVNEDCGIVFGVGQGLVRACVDFRMVDAREGSNQLNTRIAKFYYNHKWDRMWASHHTGNKDSSQDE